MLLFHRTICAVLFILCLCFHAHADTIPVGIYGTWGAHRQDLLMFISKQGFSVAITNDVEYAKKMKLKVIYPLWLTKDVANNEYKWNNFLKKTESIVKMYKNDEEIIAWYVVDEPDWNNISVNKLSELCNLIKSIDVKHPTMAVFTIPDKWKEYLALFDIVAIDPYLDLTKKYRGNELKKIQDWFDLLKSDLKSLKLDKKVWIVFGVFENRSEDPDFIPAFKKPTLDEFREMVSIAINNQIDGALFFSLTIIGPSGNYSWYLPEHDPELWQSVKESITLLKNYKLNNLRN